MYENLLRNIGLTENESKVYLSLLKIGRTTSSKIIKEANISSGKIYETLDKLYKKGLTSLTEINGIKHFEATHPKALINYIANQKLSLEAKKKEIEKTIPSLLKLQSNSDLLTSVNMIIGERSVKPLVIELLTKLKGTFYSSGIRGNKNESYNNLWWHITTTLIDGKKRKAKYIFSENTSEYYKKHKKLKFAQIKSIKNLAPVAVDIIDDNVLILSYEGELTCVHIKNKNIAESFKGFFNSLWAQAKF